MKNNKNIFLQIIAIIGAVLLFLLIITLLVFRNELCSLASLQLVDEYGMYQMTYYGDYGFDEFLEIGAESDADIEAFVTKRLLKGLPISLSETGDGCTAFVVKNEEGEILFGRNFDFMYAPSLQLYTDPKNGYASISTVNLAFAGYSEEYLPSGLNFDSFLTLAAPFLPFDGMNEKGVAIALLAVPEAQPPYNSEHVTLNTTTAIRLVLDKAATTEEAVELLRQYNVYFSADVTCHYLIADASGHSVIVEYYDNDIKVVETDKEYQIASNFIAYNDLNIGEGSTEFDRYNAVQNAIEENHGVLDEDQVIMLLSQIGVKNGNIDKLQWSVLYNLTNGDGQIFAHRKTDQIVKIHIDKSENVEADSDDNNVTEKIENKKIIVTVTENSNYVYHMLSVAKCGYDNAYGDKYKELYSKEDLAILRENASAITVVGGEHEGSLYTPLIADAAALDDSESIVDYYRSIIENAERIARDHGEQKETVESLANVFIKCYEIYNEKVWPSDKEKAEAQVALFQQKFDEMDLNVLT